MTTGVRPWSPTAGRRGLRALLAAAAVLALTHRAVADDAQPTSGPTSAPIDRSPYTLFNPVPGDQLRSFNADRPSITTGPFTIDPGHVQVEASFADYTKDRSITTGGDGGEQVQVLPGVVRVGLTGRTELDVFATPYVTQRTPQATHGVMAAASERAGSFGDMQVQAKLNLFGDDGGDHPGDAAFGIVPYLTLPTASSTKGLGTGRLQGGVALPLAVQLPADVNLSGMAQFDFPRNDANTRTGFDVLHTIVASHPVVGPLSAFVEYAGYAPVGLGHGYQAFVDTGLTLQVGDNAQLDVSVDLGRSRDTPAYTLLAGFTVRI